MDPKSYICKFLQVASRVGKGKLSMAAIGNISKVPYLDQL